MKTAYSFNITEKELKKALKFSRKNSTTDSKTIILNVISSENGLGYNLSVSDLEGQKTKDITDYGAW